MAWGGGIVEASVRRYKRVAWITVLATAAIAAAAVLPSLAPGLLPFLRPIQVDTDPENMLSAHEPVRLFHDRMKKELSLYDMVVVGVVNDRDPDGVFNPESLGRIHELAAFARTLRGEAIGEPEGQGVVASDIIAPSTVDSIQPGAGAVTFSWLMPQPPQTRQEALRVRDQALRVPFLNGTLVSEDGKAIALYLPLTRKDLSYKIYTKLKEKIATFGGDDRFHITGLPVAEDTFGVEMFIQMAISAPAAMLVIFVLMLAFFRKLVLILSPMIVAMISVIFTMGSLVIAGFPIHIMSSMIPIFIMPIAVLDSIHIISEFFEKYPATKDRRRTILDVMDELFTPMLYTSLTSAAGFASLALTPIPPVQVFGIFVAAGIMVAWVLTVTFIPAFVMFIPERTLEGFGARRRGGDAGSESSALNRFLRWTGRATFRRAKPMLAASAVVLVAAGWGISRIHVNDNPVMWFAESHDIRVADKVLNRHFGGTYMAYLALLGPRETYDPAALAADFADQARRRGEALKAEHPAAEKVFARLADLAGAASAAAASRLEFLATLEARVREITELKGQAPAAAPETPTGPGPGGPALPGGLEAPGGPALPEGLGNPPQAPASGADAPPAAEKDAWGQALLFLDEQRQAGELFKDPAVMAYQAALEEELARSGVVGKSNSLASIVKTVHRDFLSGQEGDFRLPATREGVAQMLIQFQSSHRFNDLWHFVTPDYRSAALWVQLTSGDNRDMKGVADRIAAFVKAHPPRRA